MRTPQERSPARLSLASFKTSMTTMLGLLVAGGIITWLLITDGVSDIAFRLSGELVPLYLEKVAGISIQQIGLLGSINAAATMVVPVFSGRLADRSGERWPLLIGFALIFAAFMVFLQAATFAGFALSWVILGVGSGMLGPAYQSLLSKVVPARLLGTFTGVFQGSLGVVSLPAPWLGAQLWERFSPRLPFLITALAALSVLPPIWLKLKAPRQGDGVAPVAPPEPRVATHVEP